jgi:hypothetical protein
VGGEVIRSEVRLDLDQASPQHLAVALPNEELAEQLARDERGVALEERLLDDSATPFLERWPEGPLRR